MEGWKEYNYRLYEELHCPFCGSTEITTWKEGFNHRAAFWGVIFLHIWGILFGCFCRKRTLCRCNRCSNEFSFY